MPHKLLAPSWAIAKHCPRLAAGRHEMATRPPAYPCPKKPKQSMVVRTGPYAAKKSNYGKFLMSTLGAGLLNMAQKQVESAIKNKFKRTMTITDSSKKKGRLSRYPPTKGQYRGKFKKGKKRVAFRSLKYARNGFVDTQEVSGIVNDPDCVYLTHSAIEFDYQLGMIARCLIRKMLKKVLNVSPGTEDEALDIDPTVVSASGLRFECVEIDVVSGIKYYTFWDSVAGSTIATLADNINFVNLLRRQSTGIWMDSISATEGSNISNARKWIEFNCYQRGYASANPDDLMLRHRLDMELETVHLYVKSSMKIQNRTRAADGSTDAQDVANNPIVGYKYDFKSGVPQCKVDGAYLLNSVRGVGAVNVIRAAQLPNVFKEPPLGSVFSNVKKAVKVRMQPGDIKEGSINYKVNMKLLQFLRKLHRRVSYYSGTPSDYIQMDSIGPSQMYAFEDVINVNALELIQIGYEVNREIGMYITSGRKTVSLGKFQQLTVSNQTA